MKKLQQKTFKKKRYHREGSAVVLVLQVLGVEGGLVDLYLLLRLTLSYPLKKNIDDLLSVQMELTGYPTVHACYFTKKCLIFKFGPCYKVFNRLLYFLKI